MIRHYQELMGSGKLDRILASFAPDVVVRFADFPEMRGVAELKQFLEKRFARQKNYRLTKQMRGVSGNVLICSWDGDWEDGQDGRAMEGQGVELMTIRDGKIYRWEAVFNVWERGKMGTLPIV